MWGVFEAEPQLRIVEGTFELTEKESKALAEQFPGSPDLKTVHMFRCLEGQVQYEFPNADFGNRSELDQSASAAFQKELQALRTAFEPLTKATDAGPGPLEGHARELGEIAVSLGSPETLEKEGLTKLLGNLSALLGSQAQLSAPCKKLIDAANKVFKSVPIRDDVDKYIRDKLHPRFVYFSVYKQINGAIRIPQYLAGTATQIDRLDTGEPLDRKETIDNLFYLAGLDPKKLEQIKNSLALKNKYLGECSDRLTKALRPTWLTQPIDIELVYDTGDVRG